MNILRKTVSNFVYQGQRKYMEDRYVIIKDKDFEIYGVCDGHGGEDVSNFVMGVLPKILYNKIKQKLVNLNFSKNSFISDTIFKNLLIDSFDQTNKIIINSQRAYFLSQGTTIVLAVKYNNNLWVANTGDSRCIGFINNDIFETEDHKPSSQVEKKRILENGGKIVSFSDFDVPRVVNPKNPYYGLSVSRGFGDFSMMTDKGYNLVSYIPDIYKMKINSPLDPKTQQSNNFIIMASDGFWDLFPTKAIINLVNNQLKKNSVENITNNLKKITVDNRASDNVTLIMTLI